MTAQHTDGTPSLGERLFRSLLFGVLAAIAGEVVFFVLGNALRLPALAMYLMPARLLLPTAEWLQLRLLPGEGWGLSLAFVGWYVLAIPFWTVIFGALHFVWYSGKLKRNTR